MLDSAADKMLAKTVSNLNNGLTHSKNKCLFTCFLTKGVEVFGLLGFSQQALHNTRQVISQKASQHLQFVLKNWNFLLNKKKIDLKKD